MEIVFYKYQGAGNDFVMIDNRNNRIHLDTTAINLLCDRRFGIGADGLILLEDVDGYDYKMVYYNADGNESTMCGNGGRCIAAFAKQVGAADDNQFFLAIDGDHKANIREKDLVALQMKDIHFVERNEDHIILDTGSPHYIKFVNNTKEVKVFEEGSTIRNQKRFQPKGINVNFVQNTDNVLRIRTYERGVEDETLACGTGVTAAAIASASEKLGRQIIKVIAEGGELEVSFHKINDQNYQDIWLTGPATLVFSGSIII
ncbi:MAG TPA: diaminopimelate epimerase [Edaphocola sp.]|nr:diaminopimelate epimerase [Edaphocola sp.]